MSYLGASKPEAAYGLTLVIGDMAEWKNRGRQVPSIEGYMFVDASNLCASLLYDLSPMIVVSALVGTDFDAVEIARKLGQLGFAGAYRVVTHDLPDVALVTAELRNAVPNLDVDVIDLSNIFPDRTV